MKVYIPFNSNDFNSVFTTLSISPAAYYPKRNYSFKKALTTYLNENENFLIGYEKPIFHNKDLDKDYGFPILLEIDINDKDYEFVENKDYNYFIINSTIFLFSDFKLIFRREQELQETLAKSLKSIETKYAKIAKENSVIIKKDCFVKDLPELNLPSINKNIKHNTFVNERMINRIFGVILGSSMAFSNKTSKEWKEILILLKSLNNNLSLYLNKIAEENSFEKKQSLNILSRIKSIYESIESLDESIMSKLTSTITISASDLLNSFKNSQISNVQVYELVIGGMLNKPKIDLPVLLKIEKFKRAVNSKFSSKYPNNYINKVKDAFNDIKRTIERQVTLSKKNNKLNLADIIKPTFIDNQLSIRTPKTLNPSEDALLKATLLFFIKADNIESVEYFFINRKDLLIDLAKHFKTNINGFDKSEDRKYLGRLLKSFDSLRSGFKIPSTSNEVLKSLAVLFTSGRDFLKFIENNEKEEIENPIIYYSLWGSIYGAAIIPKTTTELITDDSKNLETLITAFDRALSDYKPIQEQKETEENIVSEPNNSLANKIIEIVKKEKKVSLTNLKKEFKKSFKTNKDVENFINDNLKENICVITEKRKKTAICLSKH